MENKFVKLNSPAEFVIGAIVTPKKLKIDDDTGNEKSNYYLHNCNLTFGKEYRIIEILQCGPSGCTQSKQGCLGRPVIINDIGSRLHICGWGAPNTSFDVNNMWDI